MSPKAYTIHLIGHGHIDPTWLWRWTEGYEEVRATFRSALERMKETRDFKFTASSACFYSWVKAVDPEMFEQIRMRVKQGRWELAGGWWVEPDCNIPSGESFVRHGLYAQRFFEKEFGTRAKVGFNPDSFGHAGTLPQILKKLGIEYYAYMRPSPPHEKEYPNGRLFWWRANDGSEVLACQIPDYGGDGERVIQRLRQLPNSRYLNPGQRHLIDFYGVGNHGGGPTRHTIELILKAQQDSSMPQLVFSTLTEFFESVVSPKEKTSISTICEDLQHHARGCYSVHAEIKELNRAAEHSLMTAERFAAALWLLEGRPFPKERIQRAWQLVLYNQFHDILAGTSIQAAYEDSRDQLGEARNIALEIRNEAVQRLARNVKTLSKGNTILVFNPLPWTVRQTVKVGFIVARHLGWALHIKDDKNQVVASQAIQGERIGHNNYLFNAEVPALGYRCYYAEAEEKQPKKIRPLHISQDHIENTWWRIEFDRYTGGISSLYDKKHDLQVLREGNILSCLVDQSDTWSHGYDEWRVESGRFANAVITVHEKGPVRATLRITQQYNKSTAEQYVSLYSDHPDIDVLIKLNWQERYTMLKLAYETCIQNGTTTCDTAYGCQIRNTDGWEEPCQKWVDLTGTIEGKPYGFAVINDSKYAFDIRDNIVRMTLLRSPAYAFHDRSRHDASEPWPIMDQGWHTIRVSLVPHKGSWEETNLVRKSWEFNEPAFAHVESPHKGTLPTKSSFLKCDTENIVLSVLKQSEENESIVIRGYETTGKKTKTVIECPAMNKKFNVIFHPHEIKTLSIDPKTWKMRETNLLEE
ncbi:MAG TPA: glycoside hydrolase family 38 C-terminal domain-containing protein [Candidatus Hydrogenedentes bacterium]|nr:glycoside hydrolase family 38 C-terminal domain-containing protein [Candidatus Hydrogenedentota bacterium]HOL76860.1 glycoside hydrolase family 38 C-terminal domain-containing protein [Candidatus Hydrogenedentota bacterium]HPO85511.1 glycoside hydrolase family 38 C-terminal domain-containing protein [Candidatus Hydrogenedentota bacterium]